MIHIRKSLYHRYLVGLGIALGVAQLAMIRIHQYLPLYDCPMWLYEVRCIHEVIKGNGPYASMFRFAGGAVEDLENGRQGLFLDDARSATELAGQVRRVIENPELASHIAAEGRTATESLDWKLIARRFEVLYEQIAGETTAASPA